MNQSRSNFTESLMEVSRQGGDDAVAALIPEVYDELHDLAARRLRAERAGHTLQPTALVHEVFLKLVDQSRVDWQGRTHFFAVGAEAMRRILIDHARGRGRAKRGGEWKRVMLDDAQELTQGPDIDAMVLDDLLEALATLDATQAEIVKLRFFGGLTVEEVAELLGVSKRKVEGDWTHAKAWLRARLTEDSSP